MLNGLKAHANMTHFYYCELSTNPKSPSFMIIERSDIVKDKFNHVATVRSERQAKRMIKLLNALPDDMLRNTV